MKLFSRKSLVAAAASTALFAGMVAAPAQAETVDPTGPSTSSETTTQTEDPADSEESETPGEPTEPEQSSSDQLSSGSSNDDGNLDPGELRDWVAVFTAIIGALSTVFVFMERNF